MKKKYLILIITLVLLLVGGCKNNKVVDDNIKFSLEYTEVGEDNIFVYRDISEIIKIMKNGTGVVYLGFPECPWCNHYVKYLNEIAMEVGIDKIYYYNIFEDRKNNTEKYQEIVSLLSNKLQYDEEGNERIYVPNVSFHVDGEVIFNDYETSKDTNNKENPEEYWTEDEIIDLKNRLKTYLEEINIASNTCTSCNK